ncbi:hypothetical protein Glove_426g2 [Diversispora epigaea]|uniref:F-box/LRR-repeat protein 15-like leucin rich repeat domain-containing protein n=1 Tax=Diversispora epigaea TaxID=1348612 RepID=A0A397GYH6_9GLOM|nr:hypothetical protein Glove_426g2 [Diversispora epigaea]
MCEGQVQSAISPEIKYHTQYLFQLYLSGCKVSSNELYRITRSCPNLRHLKIKWCCGLSDRDISEIAIPIFVHSTSDNKHITDASIIEIAQNCIHLEYFGLRGSNITDASLKQIAEFYSKLLILSLVGCQKITDEGICAITLTCSNMQKYVLEDCEEITDTSVKKIAQSNPKLKYLNLNGYELISDKSVCKIVQLCPNLESLQIECCNISDVSIIALANLRNLQKLNIEDCGKISTNAIITLQNKNPTLDIFGWIPIFVHSTSDNKHITDASIIEIAQNCIHLEYFGLRGSNITDASLKQIAEFYSKLLILSLVGCQKITDEGICAITLTCSNMQKYVLEDCEEITDTSVKKIAQSNPKLKYLNLNGYELISDKSVCKIVQLCPNLESLQIECCNISDVSIIALANLRNLQKLNIEDCGKISTNAIITLQNKNPTLDIFVLLSLIGMKEEKMPIFVYNIDETSSKFSERMKGNKFLPDPHLDYWYVEAPIVEKRIW